MRSKFFIITIIISLVPATSANRNPTNNKASLIEPTIEVELPSGYTILGHSNGLSWQFLGIPYAKPPIEDLRFADTQALISSNVYLDASKMAPACPQLCMLPDYACSHDTSEDCLYLNIYTPIRWDPKYYTMYNVLVFLHGGDFIQGTAGCSLYDSRFFSNFTRTVIVTVNYRLGALGFLMQQDLGINGNLGLKDQRMALQWVNTYIKYFGGYSDISVFGQSAGAISIGAHMVSPLSMGLFSSVIIESNPWAVPLKNVKDAEYLGKKLIEVLGCKDMTCLRNVNWEDVVEAQRIVAATLRPSIPAQLLELAVQWGPVIDGTDITEQPYRTIVEGFPGRFKNQLYPTIIGTVTEEGRLFVYKLLEEPVNIFKYELLVTGLFPAKLREVTELYKPNNKTIDFDYRTVLSQIITDYVFYCPTRNITRSLAKLYNDDFILRVWSYVYDHASLYTGGWGKRYSYCEGHVCHGIELPYLFDSARIFGMEYLGDETTLVRQLGEFWGNMAEFNDPTGFQRDKWPSYNMTGQSRILIKTPVCEIIDSYRETYCDFWDKYGYLRGR